MRLFLSIFIIFNSNLYSQVTSTEYLPQQKEIKQNNIVRIQSTEKVIDIDGKDTVHHNLNYNIFHYNHNGYLDSIQEECRDIKGLIVRTVRYTYDKNGTCIEKFFSHTPSESCKASKYWIVGDSSSSCQYYLPQYDEFGNIVVVKSGEWKLLKDNDTTKSAEITYSYYKENLLKKDSIFTVNEFGIEHSTVKQYHYNKQSQLIKIIISTYSFMDCYECETHILIYNESGGLIKKMQFLKNSKKRNQNRILNEWEYDSLGNVTQVKSYSSKNNAEIWQYHYNIQSQVIQINYQGSFSRQVNLEYNENGLLQTFIRYSPSNKWKYIETFEYFTE